MAGTILEKVDCTGLYSITERCHVSSNLEVAFLLLSILVRFLKLFLFPTLRNLQDF